MLYSSIRGSWNHTNTDKNVTPVSSPPVRVASTLITGSLRTDLGEVELKRVISGQRDHEASGQVLRQWVAMVAQEQTVVTQR